MRRFRRALPFSSRVRLVNDVSSGTARSIGGHSIGNSGPSPVFHRVGPARLATDATEYGPGCHSGRLESTQHGGGRIEMQLDE